MKVKVRIPPPLRSLTKREGIVELEASTLKECLDELETRFPGFKERVLNPQGQIQEYISIYVNGEDVRFLQDLSTPLKPGDEVSIVPAIAGG